MKHIVFLSFALMALVLLASRDADMKKKKARHLDAEVNPSSSSTELTNREDHLSQPWVSVPLLKRVSPLTIEAPRVNKGNDHSVKGMM